MIRLTPIKHSIYTVTVHELYLLELIRGVLWLLLIFMRFLIVIDSGSKGLRRYCCETPASKKQAESPKGRRSNASTWQVLPEVGVNAGASNAPASTQQDVPPKDCRNNASTWQVPPKLVAHASASEVMWCSYATG